MKSRLQRVWVFCALFILLSGHAVAQDSHYWSNQYGTRADLLGGAVVGSIRDLATTYYNPAGIALISDADLILSTEAVRFSSITLKDGAGKGNDLTSFDARKAPSLFAGRFTFAWLKDHQLAYSILTRYDFNVEVSGRGITSRDAIGGILGDEDFAGEVILLQKLAETWVGLTWAHSLGERSAIGVTQYLSVRSQSGRLQTIAQAVASGGGEGAATILWDDFSYWNVRTLWKVGMAFDYSPLRFGFAVTTPSLDLFGSGSSGVNASLIGLDKDGDGNPDSELASDYQKDLDASYRSPLSVAVGAGYQIKKTALHFSAEWFDTVDEFVVIDPLDFQAQTSGETISTTVTHELDEVFNWAVGVEHTFSEKRAVYASYRTDRSGLVPRTDSKLVTSSWDINHVTVGGSFQILKLDFTLGLGFSFGEDKIERLADFEGANQNNQLLGRPAIREVTYRALKLLIGFSFPL